MKNTVTVFAYDAKKGVLTSRQNIGTLPPDYKGTSSTAEVVVHPSGKFLYGSNRGHDSIAVFTVNPRTGELTAAGHQAEGIKTPRNFAIDPTGQWLLVANQDGDSIVVFKVDRETGKLQSTGEKVAAPRRFACDFSRKVAESALLPDVCDGKVGSHGLLSHAQQTAAGRSDQVLLRLRPVPSA